MPQLAAASRKNDAFAFSWFFFLLVLWFPNDAWYAWYILGRTQRIRKSSSWIQRGPWEIQPRLHQKCQFYWEIHRYLLGISMGIIYIYIYIYISDFDHIHRGFQWGDEFQLAMFDDYVRLPRCLGLACE